jgi:hypothetical protein
MTKTEFIKYFVENGFILKSDFHYIKGDCLVEPSLMRDAWNFRQRYEENKSKHIGTFKTVKKFLQIYKQTFYVDFNYA